MPSSPPFAATLTLEARPSRALTAAVAGAYGCAAIGVPWLPMIWASGVALALAAGLSGELVRACRPVRLQWSADGPWYDLDHPRRGALELGAPTFVSRWLVVLVLVERGGRAHRYAMTRAALDRGPWRRLLGRLRVQGAMTARPLRGWRGTPDEA